MQECLLGMSNTNIIYHPTLEIKLNLSFQDVLKKAGEKFKGMS
jgi:hypothetical protein